MSTNEWAAWAQAGGTTAAAMIAAGALVLGVRDKRRAQAEKVSVWHDGSVQVRNGSDLPAWIIDIAIVDHSGTRRDDTGQAGLRAGEQWQAFAELDRQWTYEQFAHGEVRLELRFTDSAGRRRLRTWPSGRLARIRRIRRAGLPG